MPIIVLALIYAAAWYFQGQLFINWDVSQILHSTQLMLDGGTYSNNFFMPNPPSILMLYTPPVIFSHFFDVDLILIFRIYIILIASLLLGICYSFNNLIFAKDRVGTNVFYTALAATFLVLPLYQYGQRECLLYMLAFPYLLLMVARLDGKTIMPKFSVAVGLLAGIGLAIKPQFIFLPLMVECYYFLRTRKWLSFLRPETIAIAIFLSLYVIAVLCFFSDYIYNVMPYLVANYYKSVAQPWPRLILNPIAVFGALMGLLVIFQYEPKRLYNNLFAILLSALLGYSIIYFSQRTLFIYHSLPVLFISTLLLLMYLIVLVNKKPSKYDYLLTGVVGLGAFWLLISTDRIVALNVLHPELFFSYFLALFLILFYLAKPQAGWIAGVKAVIVTLISYLAFYYAKHTEFYPYVTLITLITLFVMFKIVNKRLYIGFLSAILFSAPMFVEHTLFTIGSMYKSNVLLPLISYARQQTSKPSIYVLSVIPAYSAPLMHYSNVKLAGRFDCLWMIHDLANMRMAKGDLSLRNYIQHNNNKRFFINMVAEDIHKEQPDLILVDIRKFNSSITGERTNFDIVSYFVENPAFQTEWQKYHYVDTIGDIQGDGLSSFKLAVYQRTRDRE